MAIVAYGYGLDTSQAGAIPSEGTFLIALMDEPDIILEDDIQITLEEDSIDITLEEDINIEVD